MYKQNILDKFILKWKKLENQVDGIHYEPCVY